MYFIKQSEALPTSTIFDNNVEKNIHYHVYFKTSNCLPLCFQVCFAKKFEYVESAQNQADFNIVFLGERGVVVVFSTFKSFILKAFLVNTILIPSTGPKKVATVKRWPLAKIAVGLAQSVKYLTAGEVAGWIPGTGLNLSVLKQTEK